MKCTKFLHVFLVFVLLFSIFCIPVSAEAYSTEYPSQMGNSGSPVWLHCELRDFGEYCLIFPPDTHLQSFAFDSRTKYSLINNTDGIIYGKAYGLNGATSYLFRWGSFDTLYLQVPNSSGTGYTLTAAPTTAIYGTTLDIVDLIGDRGNDLYKYDISSNQAYIVICACVVAVVLLFVISLVFKPRLFRM